MFLLYLGDQVVFTDTSGQMLPNLYLPFPLQWRGGRRRGGRRNKKKSYSERMEEKEEREEWRKWTGEPIPSGAKSRSSRAKRRWNMNGRIHSQRSKIKMVFPIELNFTHRNYEIVWRNLSNHYLKLTRWVFTFVGVSLVIFHSGTITPWWGMIIDLLVSFQLHIER